MFLKRCIVSNSRKRYANISFFTGWFTAYSKWLPKLWWDTSKHEIFALRLSDIMRKAKPSESWTTLMSFISWSYNKSWVRENTGISRATNAGPPRMGQTINANMVLAGFVGWSVAYPITWFPWYLIAGLICTSSANILQYFCSWSSSEKTFHDFFAFVNTTRGFDSPKQRFYGIRMR